MLGLFHEIVIIVLTPTTACPDFEGMEEQRGAQIEKQTDIFTLIAPAQASSKSRGQKICKQFLVIQITPSQLVVAIY